MLSRPMDNWNTKVADYAFPVFNKDHFIFISTIQTRTLFIYSFKVVNLN